MPKTDYVARAVAASFRECCREEALASLRKLRGRGERERIKVAIIVLAQGNLRELRSLVAAANEDYRDVLYWAEYPEDSGVGRKRTMTERYRRLGIPIPDPLR